MRRGPETLAKHTYLVRGVSQYAIDVINLNSRFARSGELGVEPEFKNNMLAVYDCMQAELMMGGKKNWPYQDLISSLTAVDYNN